MLVYLTNNEEKNASDGVRNGIEEWKSSMVNTHPLILSNSRAMLNSAGDSRLIRRRTQQHSMFSHRIIQHRCLGSEYDSGLDSSLRIIVFWSSDGEVCWIQLELERVDGKDFGHLLTSPSTMTMPTIIPSNLLLTTFFAPNAMTLKDNLPRRKRPQSTLKF